MRRRSNTKLKTYTEREEERETESPKEDNIKEEDT